MTIDNETDGLPTAPHSGEGRPGDGRRSETGRRTFMKRATFTVGGLMGAAMAIPLVRAFLYPVGRRVVSAPDSPIDLGSAAKLVSGGPPVRLPIIASGVRDAWATSEDVAVGSCWVQKQADGEITAFSSVCPHLGCSVSYSEQSDDFRCPCHNSAFDRSGAKKDKGPAKRGLDPLQVSVVDGRLRVVYQRFRNDIPEREPV